VERNRSTVHEWIDGTDPLPKPVRAGNTWRLITAIQPDREGVGIGGTVETARSV